MSDIDLPREPEEITRQLLDIITENTTWADIGEQLDVSHYQYKDEHPEWHPSSKDFDAVFKAILWAESEEVSHTGVPKRLEENPDIAEAFGFDPDELPHGDTFRLAYTNRFENLQHRFDWMVDNLNTIAEHRACPIGTWGLDIPASDGNSERTLQRLLRSQAHRVMEEEVGDLMYSFLDLPRSENAVYDEEDIKRVLTKMSLCSAAANDTAKIDGDDKFLSDLADLDEAELKNLPFYVDGPTGETVLTPLHELEPDEICDMINQSAQKIFTRLKPHADFDSHSFLAIDITYVAYWGETEGLEWISGTPPDDKEYEWCYKFATATIVGENVHLGLAMLPIGNAEVRDPEAYPGSEVKSYRAGEVVRELMDVALEYVPGVRCVYADREFGAADVIIALEHRGVYYMIPAPRNDRLKRWLERNVTDGLMVVEDGWAIYGPTKGGVANTRVETTLIGAPNDPSDTQYAFDDIDASALPAYAKEVDAVPFYTNTEVDDEIGLDRRMTLKKVKKYVMRGGIETSYRKIKGFMPSTTSKDFSVRLFHFGFAVLMYNMWLLVDFLVQSGLSVEIRYKPRISAERFRKYIERWVGADIF